MKIKSLTSAVKAEVELPASKSESNRVLIITALAKSAIDAIGNLSKAKDTQVLKEILFFNNKCSTVDVGHAGTAMRFLTAFFAVGAQNDVVITGSSRMQQRPISVLVDALNSIGADISYLNNEGYPPVLIKKNTLDGLFLQIDASVSSQYISSILMIAPVLANGLIIKMTGTLVSRPYIDMTIDLMQFFGVTVLSKNNEIKILPQVYKVKPIIIESDWSAASYWYEIAALSNSCQITLLGLKKESRQGDQKIAELYKKFGVKTEWHSNGVVLIKSSSFLLDKSKLYQFDLNETPDLAQALICTCAGLGIESRFEGLSTLKIKETDRLFALKKELMKFNVDLQIINDSIAHLDRGQTIIKSSIPIETYEDHRMAMSFAPLALVINEVSILNSEVVNKSYPSFWIDLEKVFAVEF